ncbi:helix-turn-helix domain-containing protein [Saccharothrix variisporea]|uniref:HTH luxR-type domain-containing protein n=1 Tax=Saccharothrix variisporea TaxID=543527 RepID=A0A495XQE9_9PSEU|nr:hypothetical protein [Saccharothrix variisporea]RKT74673.1 hypothetical protein DFJ66_8040 [Saccharothrix variisporea]
MIDDQADQGSSAGANSDRLENRLYDYAIRQGAIRSLEVAAAELGVPISEIYVAVARLVELHLLRTDPTTRDHLLPSVPQLAATALVSPIERAIYQWQELADRFRERIAGIAGSARRDAEHIGVVDGVSGVAEIRGMLGSAGRDCRRELVVLRPGRHDEELVDELLETCYDALDRGVSIRLICPHQSRARFASRAKVSQLLDAGAQIRTRSHLPRAAVVFDESLAVLLDLPATPGGQPTARRVRDRGVVRFVVDMVNQHWEDATPYSAAAHGYAEAADDLHRSIARLMARGLTDDGVARHLGMSVRTCRRHIATLLHNLNSVSRFQAGVRAAALLDQPARPQPG